MQYRPPFRVLGLVAFKLLSELSVLQAWLEPVYKTSSPRRGHRKPRLDFSVGDWMLDLGLGGLAREVSEARRKSIPKRLG